MFRQFRALLLAPVGPAQYQAVDLNVMADQCILNSSECETPNGKAPRLVFLVIKCLCYTAIHCIHMAVIFLLWLDFPGPPEAYSRTQTAAGYAFKESSQLCH